MIALVMDKGPEAVADSGNAELVGPHLHFELRDPDGRAINPREDLLAVMPADECHDDQ